MQLALETPTEVYARKALIIYTNHDHTEGLVMEHALREQGGHPVMAEGINVTRDTIDTLLHLNAMHTLLFVPEHVVAVGSTSLAWISPPRARRLLFQGAYDKAVAQLDGQVLPQPRLLFVVRGRAMFVYALKGQDRPGAQTTLCLAPYYNVFSNHQVCQGSMQLPTRIDPNNTNAWEDAFFYSNFVKPAGPAKVHAYPGTYRELWDAVVDAGMFRDEWLLETGLTLEQALKGGR
ncbi:PRTRC system protein B [Deinococcus aluminii]|uniref:Uncharacterized protein n=1 Tax=Deinococcus aluminii TaxID=1656885 RepID=A0ABP9XGP6_9DEIO